MLVLTDRWRATYPGACIGVLAMQGVANPEESQGLEVRKQALEADLRQRYQGKTRADIKSLPIIEAYTDYYKSFRKTYHVQHQLESVALKGRDIPHVAALVEAMFMAELENLLLTAGHDLDRLAGQVTVDVAQGTESYTGIGGEPLQLKPGDMFIADTIGVLSSIIYGPDRRTQIRPGTRNVLFTVYGPAGIPPAKALEHLETIKENVHLIEPTSQVSSLAVYEAE